MNQNFKKKFKKKKNFAKSTLQKKGNNSHNSTKLPPSAPVGESRFSSNKGHIIKPITHITELGSSETKGGGEVQVKQPKVNKCINT